MSNNKAKRKKVKVGEVISNKMDKTVVISVEREFTHPLYRKKIRKRKKIKAHDPDNKCREGDMVRVAETRPLSKEKYWRIIEILKRK